MKKPKTRKLPQDLTGDAGQLKELVLQYENCARELKRLQDILRGVRERLIEAYTKNFVLADALVIIRSMEYENPVALYGRDYWVATTLEHYGLVEHDPSAPHVFRPTQAGLDWREHLKGL